MSAEPIDLFLQQHVPWVANPPRTEESDVPFATHSGVLVMFDIELHCHRLSNGKTIIEAADFEKLMKQFAEITPTPAP